MTEERIQNAAETIHSANKLSITKGILNVIAAEARKEGIEELQAALINKLTDDSWRLKKLIETQAERLKEGG